MARAELADCGHPVPDFPVFTDLRVLHTLLPRLVRARDRRERGTTN